LTLLDLVNPAIDGFFFGILKDNLLSLFISLNSVIFFSLTTILLVLFGFFIGFKMFLDIFSFISFSVRGRFFNRNY
jgi:hypothetical protein